MEFEVHLSREGEDPWGFRLIGGTDFSMPLTVVKVLPNSPADKAGLQNGDTVSTINGAEADSMTHDDSRQVVASARYKLDLQIVRGLYDPVLDDFEPIYEPLDQDDFDQPSRPTEVPDLQTDICPEISEILDQTAYERSDPERITLDDDPKQNGIPRPLTTSPYINPTKPYRPFSTEPVPTVPPLEDPIILNPNYQDEFGKLGIDEDFLPKTRFKLPISEQYDPDGTKQKMKIGQVKETVENQTLVTEINEEKVSTEEVMFVKEGKTEIELDRIEMTASSVVDESIEKAVSVAEEIKKEIEVELKDITVSDKSVRETAVESIQKEVALSETKIVDSIELESQEAAREVIELVDLIDKTTEEIVKQTESKVENKEEYKIAQEKVFVEDKRTEEKTEECKSETREIKTSAYHEKSDIQSEEKNTRIEQLTEETIEDCRVQKSKLEAKDIQQRVSGTENQINTGERKTERKSTAKLLSEQRAYTIGLQTIPKIKGSIQSSYHYNLLLKTFFIHLTDVMVALSRFILTEPVFSKSEEKQETQMHENFVKKEQVTKTVFNKMEDSQVADSKVATKEELKVDRNEVTQDKKQQSKVVAKKDVEVKEKVQYEDYLVQEADDLEVEELTEIRKKSGSRMAQLTEKKSEELTQRMDAVITEFQTKAGIEESEETFVEKRSRSRNQQEEIIQEKVDTTKSTQHLTETTSSAYSSSTAELIEKTTEGSKQKKRSESREGKNMYIAIVEAHVYTNKDAIPDEQTGDFSESSSVVSADEVNVALEAAETVSTEKVALEHKEVKKESAKSFIEEEKFEQVKKVEKAQVVEKKAQEIKQAIIKEDKIEAVQQKVQNVDDDKIVVVKPVELETITQKNQEEITQNDHYSIQVKQTQRPMIKAEKFEEVKKAEVKVVESEIKVQGKQEEIVQKEQSVVQVKQARRPIIKAEKIKEVKKAEVKVEESEIKVQEKQEEIVQKAQSVVQVKQARRPMITAGKNEVKKAELIVVESEIKVQERQEEIVQKAQSVVQVKQARRPMIKAEKIEEVKKTEVKVEEPEIKVQEKQEEIVQKAQSVVQVKQARRPMITAGKNEKVKKAEVKVVESEIKVQERQEEIVQKAQSVVQVKQARRPMITAGKNEEIKKAEVKVVESEIKVQERHEEIVQKAQSVVQVKQARRPMIKAEKIEEVKKAEAKEVESEIEVQEKQEEIVQKAQSVVQVKQARRPMIKAEKIEGVKKSEAKVVESEIKVQEKQEEIVENIVEPIHETKQVRRPIIKAAIIAEAKKIKAEEKKFVAKEETLVTKAVESSSETLTSQKTETKIGKDEAIVTLKAKEEVTQVAKSEEILKEKNIAIQNKVEVSKFELNHESIERTSTTKYAKENLKLDLQIDSKPKTIDENNNTPTPTPTTPTPLTDEYIFKLEIPLPKRSATPIPRDCTPTPEDEDPNIVKKKLMPYIDTKVEEEVKFDPPLPSPPGIKVTSPVYTKPGLRGGADRPEIKKEEILEIERKSSLLASAIDQTIKSIEEYKEEVGIKEKNSVSNSSSETEVKTSESNVVYNGYAKVIETKVYNTIESVKMEEETKIQSNGIETNDVKIVEKPKVEANGNKLNVEDNIQVMMNGNGNVEQEIQPSKVKEDPNVVENKETIIVSEADKKDPMEGYRPVEFNPDDLQQQIQEHRYARLSASVPVLTASQERELYKTPSGELIGTVQGIVDGLEEAVVDTEVAKEMGKPGITEEKIAELMSGESEMLREAHVMGLSRVIASHMHRADDSSVDFKKIKPLVESLKDSEVLKALNEEILMKSKEEKKKDERKWTTFLQKPKRPVPTAKFGYPGYVEEEKNVEEPYKVKIVKQPKPKVAPDYKPNPEDFNTGLLPWEERALREPTPPPVEPEEPILVPEEAPEILEAVDPLPESEVPDLEDSGIPLPPPKEKEPTPPSSETLEIEYTIEELDLDAIVEETEKIVEENLAEEMDQNNLAEQLMMSVQNMVDPEAPLEQQLAQMRAQLAALAQLPCVIQQSLDMVTRQLGQLAQLEAQQQALTKTETAEELAMEQIQNEAVIEENNVIQEEPQAQQETEVQPAVEKKEELSTEEIERMRKEEEEMIEEQKRLEKQKKDLMEQARLEHESRQVKQRPTPRVGKPKPVFGPLSPEPRPLVLPGGRKWRKPKDAYNEQFIAETLAAQAEIIQGNTKGINFMKFEKPPVSLDHLQNSEVFKMVHNMDQVPLKRVEMLTPVMAEVDYREKCRSITPCTDRMAREEHLDIPQQVQP